MKIAVLSGKGGTGKTFVSVNLAVVADTATYLDCDVEEPNGHLFLNPEITQKEPVFTLIPQFDEEKCIHCGKCVEFCRFNALAIIDKKHKVFPEVCHSCGGCTLVCPTGAITENKHPIGFVEIGTRNNLKVITGILNLGEASGVPVIKATLEHSSPSEGLTIIDCPPGSACTVLESVQIADYCILVAEPTKFGLHNFDMVYELVNLLEKPCSVIINKCEDKETIIDTYCNQHGIPVLSHIPYSQKLAYEGAKAQVATEQNVEMRDKFIGILEKIYKEVIQ